MVPQNARLIALSLTAGLVLAGCASSFVPSGPQSSVPGDGNGPATSPDPVGKTSASTGTEPPRQQNPAAVALLSDSREAIAAGDYAEAAITLERAVAIDPNDAMLWIELAELRWHQGDRAQADSLARKALTLAGNDRSLILRARRLTGR